jgi:hypothetical protein
VLDSGAREGCEIFLIRHQSCSVLLVVKFSKSLIGDRGKKQNWRFRDTKYRQWYNVLWNVMLFIF